MSAMWSGPRATPREATRGIAWLVAALALGLPGSGRSAAPSTQARARVLTTSPGQRATTTTELQVMFDRPMAPLGASTVEGFVITTEPPLRGRIRWASPELLVFDPEALPPATRFAAKLEWRGSGASPVDGLPVSWTFETPGPEVDGLWPEETLRRGQAVILRLTQPVSPVEAAKHLEVAWKASYEGDVIGEARSGSVRKTEKVRLPVRVSAATPDELKSVLQQDELRSVLDDERAQRRASPGLWKGATRLLAVRPASAWPLDATISVRLKPGLVGRLGPLASGGTDELEITSPAGFRVAHQPCGAGGCTFDQTILIELTGEIRDSEAKRVQVTPRPDRLCVRLGNWYESRRDSTVEIDGHFLAGVTYHVTLPATLRDVRGRALGETNGGRAVVLDLPFPKLPKLSLSPGDGIFAEPTPAHAGAQARFIRSLQVRARELNDAEAVAALRTPHYTELNSGLLEAATVHDVALDIKGPNGWAERVIDLDALVGSRRGMLAIEVRPGELAPGATGPAPPAQRRLIQRTDIAPIVWISPRHLALQAVRHSDGSPIGGAIVSLSPGPGQALQPLGRTGANGLLDTVLRADNPAQPVLVVRTPDAADGRFLKVSDPRAIGTRERGLDVDEQARLYATVDRDLLRPGDLVHVVGWALVDAPSAPTGWRRLPAGAPAEVKLKDRSNKIIATLRTALNDEGKLWGELKLPAKPSLGRGSIEVTVGTTTSRLPVRIEDVQPPELEVELSAPSSLVRGAQVPVAIQARQLSGEPAAVSSMTIASSCRAVRAPAMPALEAGWVTGLPTAQRTYSRRWTVAGPFPDGKHRAELASKDVASGAGPNECSIDVAVTGLTRDRAGESTRTFVHAAPAYLALKAPATVETGQRVTVLVRAVDPTGRRVHAGDAAWTVTAVDGRKAVVGHCVVRPTADRDADCRLETPAPGVYRILATGAPHVAPAEVMLHVTARPQIALPATAPSRSELELRLSTNEVAPGSPLTATITSARDTAGLLVVERAGIRELHPYVIKEGRAVVVLTAKETWVPGVVVETAQPIRDARGRFTLGQRSATLQVSTATRRLAVAIRAPSDARPGSRVPLEITVSDHAGKPTRARLAVWAVNEAYLLETGHRVANPADKLVPSHRNATTLIDPFRGLLTPYRTVGDDPSLAVGEIHGVGGLGLLGEGSGGGGTSEAWAASAAAPVPRRTRLNPVPLFVGDLATDENGKAVCTLPLPDDLTRFRITVLAAAALPDGNPMRFGLAETGISAKQPLVLRAATPRLLRPGDLTETAAVARNLTGRDGVLELKAALTSPAGAAPAAELLSDATVKLAIRDGEEQRVAFRVAGRRPGTAHLELVAVLHAENAADEADRLRTPIEVEAEPATVDRSAAYLTLAGPGTTSMPIHVPEGAARGGGVWISPSTSMLTETLDAAQYLVDYPHGCAEQTAGAILGLLAYRAQSAFGIPVPAVSEAVLAQRIARLVSMQTTDGGFAYWPGHKVADTDASVYATWVLAQARAAGVSVDATVLERAGSFVARKARSLEKEDAPEGLAMALLALASAGRALPTDIVSSLDARRDSLEPLSLAALILAMERATPNDARVSGLAAVLAGRVQQTPGGARLAEAPVGSTWSRHPFQSATRTHAMVTLALERVPATRPLATKLMRTLLDRRTDGRWRNTQENAFALLAAAEHARREQASGPSVLKASLGERVVFDRDLRSNPRELQEAFVPREMIPATAAAGSNVGLTLQLRGSGPVYVRAAAEWVLSAPRERAEGLELERVLEIPSQDGVSTATEDGVVPCRIRLRARVPLRYVAITVPLAAGLEGDVGLGRGASARGSGPPVSQWISHYEMWRDRVSIYADRLEPGTYEMTLRLRAVTPGEYVMPAATAEAMYEPEVGGRTGRDRVRILESSVTPRSAP